jgi:hypothetical protein
MLLLAEELTDVLGLTDDETELLALDDALLLILVLTELEAELLGDDDSDEDALLMVASTGPVTG